MSNIELFVTKCSPVNWFHTAEELKISIDNLKFDETSFTNQVSFFISSHALSQEDPIVKNAISKGFFLLAGFCIENLLKGLLIYKDSSLINKGYIEKSIRTHDLNKLYIKYNKQLLNTDELVFLNIVSEAIPYWGRYPVPLIADQLRIEKIYSERFQSLFDLVYSNLHEELLESLKNGWKSGLTDNIGGTGPYSSKTFHYKNG